MKLNADVCMMNRFVLLLMPQKKGYTVCLCLSCSSACYLCYFPTLLSLPFWYLDSAPDQAINLLDYALLSICADHLSEDITTLECILAAYWLLFQAKLLDSKWLILDITQYVSG